MKIKTRLQLSIILSLILTVTIGLFVLFALKKMNTEVKEERTVTEIVKGMAELKSATHEYLLHPTDRSLMQWNSTYDYLTKLVMKNANEFENPAEKIVLGKILKTIKRFKAAFSIVTTGFGKEQGLVRPKSAISPDLRDRLIGELLVKPQATVSPVFQLQRVIQAELMATQKNSALLTIIFILILAFLVTAISLWINRSIARPIAELEKDIRIIGSGNLDHKVGTTAKDEIGQLSRAFDMMTGDLKGTTASIVELNKEIGERKRAEEAFRESEAQKTAILDGISTNLAFVNEDLEILWANKISADSVNRNMDEIIGKKCYELWADPNAPCDDCPTAKAFQTKKIEQTIIHSPDGRVWEEKGEPVFDEKGGLIGVLEIAHDITAKAQAEEALRESEEKYKAIFSNAQVALFQTRISDGKLVEINERYANMAGYSNIGDCMAEFNAASAWADPNARKELLRVLKEKGFINDYETQIIRRDGTRIWISFSATTFSKQGFLEGSIVDINDRKQAEEKLTESEEKYRSMMESMKDPIYICSPDFRVEYMNPAMIRRAGRDATGENCFKALHDLDEKCPRCMHDKAQQGEYFESEIVSPKDNRSYHVSNSPIIHGDGSISKMTIYRDTTDLKKLETQLQQAQKMEAVGTLAGGIAHDFNNILGGIIGYAELAKMKAPEGSNVIAYLDKMIKSSDRAADLIKQILTLSRRHKQKQRPVQVRHIVKEALDLLRATLPTTIEIRKDVAKDTGVVNADPTQMHQVIMNLTTNAGHAMQENGGVLEVTLANVELDDLEAAKHLDLDAGSYLRLMVSDTGYGMSSEIMERIFDPYFTTKDTGEGTGLGLAVAQGIVKAHGGTITVYSEPGKGTTFHVYLPVILELEREEKGSEEPLPTGSESILFIDDEEVLIEIGGQILEHLGYKVVTEKSSVQALELFRAEPDRFDLVITDMTMPHMTGDKFARELMKIRPHISVILCTGHSTLVLEEKAKDIGIRAFVMKPLVMRNLAETVRKVLDEK